MWDVSALVWAIPWAASAGSARTPKGGLTSGFGRDTCWRGQKCS